MRISSFCLSLALISNCTAYAQAQDSRYSRYEECWWRKGRGYYCIYLGISVTCCEVADTPRCVPKSELGSQRCECVDKYDCFDTYGVTYDCWRYTCIKKTTTARPVTRKPSTFRVKTLEPYYCDSDSDCVGSKNCEDGKCRITHPSDPFDNIGVRLGTLFGCTFVGAVPLVWFCNCWLPRFLERRRLRRERRQQERNLRVRTEPGNSNHTAVTSEVTSLGRETDEHEFVSCCYPRCLWNWNLHVHRDTRNVNQPQSPTEATSPGENEHEMQTANNSASTETVLEVEGDTPEASPPYNPAYNPSHSAPVLGTSNGSAVSVGVPAGGANEDGEQEITVANSNLTVAEIRDNVPFPGAPPPYHSLNFERQQNASENLPMQPPPSYEATVGEILL